MNEHSTWCTLQSAEDEAMVIAHLEAAAQQARAGRTPGISDIPGAQSIPGVSGMGRGSRGDIGMGGLNDMGRMHDMSGVGGAGMGGK